MVRHAGQRLIAAALMVLVLGGVGQAATPTEIEQATGDGLAWLVAQQQVDGSWVDAVQWDEPVGTTALVLLKLSDYAREQGFVDPLDSGYVFAPQYAAGVGYLLSQVQPVDISAEPAADGNHNGLGAVINSVAPSNGHETYNTAIALAALSASRRPDLYGHVVQEALDYIAFAQNDATCGVHRGGWRYDANPCVTSDNSNSGYAALGVGLAQSAPPAGFGLGVPAFVLDELNLWIDEIQDPVDGDADDGGSRYTPELPGANILRTGHLLYEMALVGDTTQTPRVQDAVAYIERSWYDAGTGWLDHRQAMFALMKGLEALDIERIDLDGDGTPEHDWFDEVSTHLVNTQSADGSWPTDVWAGPLLSTTWALLALQREAATPPAEPGRVDATQKGSLLVYNKVELRWDAGGQLVQDTFIDLTNDYPGAVDVQMYFVNGDAALDAVYDDATGELRERAHPGCNWVDNRITLTGNEPAFWSALTGQEKGVSPFTVLDPASGVFDPADPLTWPGRPAGDGSDHRVLRGFIVAWAVDAHGEEMRWNHLTGDALVVDYGGTGAWAYNAWAFGALNVDHGQPTGTPGELWLDGVEYESCFDYVVLDFYATGASALTGGPDVEVAVDTDLTLLPMLVDVRQDGMGGFTTKAKFDIWNQNEVKFSGTERCITCWDQALLGQYELPNHFLRAHLQTNKGKARIDGMASIVCDEYGPQGQPILLSVDAPLLGVAAKVLDFYTSLAPDRGYAGLTLVGTGDEVGVLRYDVLSPPPEQSPAAPSAEAAPKGTR